MENSTIADADALARDSELLEFLSGTEHMFGNYSIYKRAVMMISAISVKSTCIVRKKHDLS